MVNLVAFKNQLDDKHHFESLIYNYQRFKKLPNPEHIHIEWDFGETMFSSSGRGWRGIVPGVGTRFVPSIRDAGKWDTYPLLITPEKEIELYDSCQEIVGSFYDWLGIIGQPLPGNIQLGWMWYCSEACHSRLAKIGVIEPKGKILPGEVVEIYRKAGLIKAA